MNVVDIIKRSLRVEARVVILMTTQSKIMPSININVRDIIKQSLHGSHKTAYESFAARSRYVIRPRVKS